MVNTVSFSKVVGILIAAGAITSVNSRSYTGYYDQRQTGDYNVRLNLKDFYVIAILNGDYDNDDYEYDYEIPSDYTDFPLSTTQSTTSNSASTTVPTVTIKPKPLSTTTTTTTTTASTLKPSPTAVPHKSSSITPSTTTLKASSTLKAQTSLRPASAVTTSSLLLATNKSPITTVRTFTSTFAKSTTTSKSLPKMSSPATSTEKPSKTFTYSYQTGLSGDRIPVIVLQQNEDASRSAMISSQVTILPEAEESFGENAKRNDTLGEIHHKKCPNGYTRDKNGRCRKLWRPPLFDFSRLTSNLASKIRRTSSQHSYINNQENS